MKTDSIRVLHITNNLGIGGVQKIIYQLAQLGSKEFEFTCVASTGGVYVDRLEQIEVPHFQIPDLSTKNVVEIANIIKELKRIVKEYSINVIHCHHRMAVFFAKLVGKNTEIIYNNHTIYSDKRLFSRIVLKNINLIADGTKARDNLIEYFRLPDRNITIINNAVDGFDGSVVQIPETKRAKEDGYFIVMNSSRLHPQKGMQYFVDAAKILLEKGYKIKFFIVGDGPQKKQLERQIEGYKLENDILFLGFRNDIKNTISQCDVLVLTSLYEGLPLTPMEAFSVGIPVVATDIDGTREVIEDNKNGILVEPKNPIAIAKGIELLFHDRILLDTYGNNAYDTYVNNFSIDNFLMQYLTYYSKLC